MSNLLHHERIQDPDFQKAVALMDAGDAPRLRLALEVNPGLVHQVVEFEEGGYFGRATLLDFIAENPVRHNRLPVNAVEIAKILLDAGAAPQNTLGLVVSSRVARESGQQSELIRLLVQHGADANMAVPSAIVHGEFLALGVLEELGANITVESAAATGRLTELLTHVEQSSATEKQLALGLACQFGHLACARILLESGTDTSQRIPEGGHSHSTPLHQAALAGHLDVVRLLVGYGAPLNATDSLFGGTPLSWARHANQHEVATFLAAQEPSPA